MSSGSVQAPGVIKKGPSLPHALGEAKKSFAAIFAPTDDKLASNEERRAFLGSNEDPGSSEDSLELIGSAERTRPPGSTMRHSASTSVLEMGMDWRRSVNQPFSYRVGNSTLHFQKPLVLALSVILLGLFVLVYVMAGNQGKKSFYTGNKVMDEHAHLHQMVGGRAYNIAYPLSQATITPKGLQYKIAVIADPDEASKDPDKGDSWQSYYKTGLLTYDTDRAVLEWDDAEPTKLKSALANGGRGMELSELIVFNGKLYTVDDRTGVIYQIDGNKVVPWVILADGNGGEAKGFKGEWFAVKDEHLYVGGLGKEWTTPDGVVLNFNPMFVKRISMDGQVEHLDWHDNYMALKKSAGIDFPGYMIHEAAAWSKHHNKWFFMPRRASKTKYNDVDDERRGTNMMFIASEDFSDIQLRRIGTLDEPSHGFSTFKFIPDTQDSVIVALKSEELEGQIATYAMIFNIDGKILVPETKFADIKYEGIEFV